MKKVFLSFGLLLIASFTTVIFNSYGKDDDNNKEVKNPLTYDEGVIINGVKWATRNIDKPGTFSSKPESAGMFYQWNRNIGWSATNPMINSNGGTEWDDTMPEGNVWEKINDPSPAGWRVPTLAEIQSLLDDEKVDNQWTTINGIKGRKFTDKDTGNSLFFPAAGSRNNVDGTLEVVGHFGNYWSDTPDESNETYAYRMICGTNVALSGYLRNVGRSVRAVAE